jgi:hypothetical protein
MGVVIGGEKAWKVRRLGDLGIAYHWINGEPAMCLFPIRKRIATAGSFVIPIESSFKYVHSNGHPNIEYFKFAAAEAAETMGFSREDKFIKRKIIDAIADGMSDLIEMPPEPPDMVSKAVQENVGEMSMIMDGEVIAEKELTALDANELSGVH